MKAKRMLAIVAIAFAILCGFAFASAQETKAKEAKSKNVSSDIFAAKPENVGDTTPVVAEEKDFSEKSGTIPVFSDALRQRMLYLAQLGEFGDELIELFRRDIFDGARRWSSNAIPEDFWTWAKSKPVIYDGLTIGLQKGNINMALRLQDLRENFPEQVESHSNLALAFAFTRSSGRFFENDEKKKEEMLDSFRYYLDNENLMRISLRDSPWLILIFIADNNVPITERKWALDKYLSRSRTLSGDIYNEPPYDIAKAAGKGARIKGHPYTLENILRYGGVCADRAYYASRVLKCFGIPAVDVGGTGERGNHAWVAWVEPQRWQFKEFGRYEDDKYYTGNIRWPGFGSGASDSELKLLAKGTKYSSEKYFQALVACGIYERVAVMASRESLFPLLEAAIKRNPFCTKPWQSFADAADRKMLSPEKVIALANYLMTQLSEEPDYSLGLLRRMLTFKGAEAAKEEIVKTIRLLDDASKIYTNLDRPDLAVEVCRLKAKYLEEAGFKDSALELYLKESGRYSRKHYFYRLLSDTISFFERERLHHILLAYLEEMIKEVPKFSFPGNRVSPCYGLLAQKYVQTLSKMGRVDEAQQWQERWQEEIKKTDASASTRISRKRY